MAYVPIWESLAEVLARVMATGLSMPEAKRDICRALSEGRLHFGPWIKEVETRRGALVSRRLVGQPRSRGDQRNIIGRPRVPVELCPDDFEGENSRPKKPWRDDDGFLVHIGKLELSTADVNRVLLKDRPSASPEGAARVSQIEPDLENSMARLGWPPRERVHSVEQPSRDRPARRIAEDAMNALYPNGVPNDLPNDPLFNFVDKYLKDLQPRPRLVSKDTILRAAGRRR
ncbi:MAG TPA: hypothetical protein VNY10_20630 [Roseiarcus sp.]|nr:hypothetical protein [Roseiarcus sp.]